jgi:hypothetical protein
MNDQILEEAVKIFWPAQTAPTISEYQREQLALYANLDRLRAERLAREAGVNWRASPVNGIVKPALMPIEASRGDL